MELDEVMREKELRKFFNDYDYLVSKANPVNYEKLKLLRDELLVLL